MLIPRRAPRPTLPFIQAPRPTLPLSVQALWPLLPTSLQAPRPALPLSRLPLWLVLPLSPLMPWSTLPLNHQALWPTAASTLPARPLNLFLSMSPSFKG